MARAAVFFLLSALLLIASCDALRFLGKKGEYEALLEFKAGFEDPGGYFSTWKEGTDCCLWKNVYCNTRGHVIKLWIEPSYPPEGVYPSRKAGPPQNFGESLGRLLFLEELGLCNVIFNAPAPKSIGYLPKLRNVRLELNSFVGSIPSTYGELKAIKYLRLNSKLTGSIPEALCKLVGLLSLDLQNNKLGGKIPECLVFLQNLTVLDLSHNYFGGPIPSIIGGFSQMKILKLRDNKFSGFIPEELHHLWNLNSLDLAQNQLMGRIPNKISDLVNLYSIDLAQNQLSGFIPRELGTLPILMFLSLYGNFLHGEIPKELSNLPSITSIILSHNRFTGTLPKEFGNVPARLRLQLDVSGNLLSGDLPDNLSNLGGFYANDNYFRGSFPVSLTAVEQVELSNNMLCSLDFYKNLPANVSYAIRSLKLNNNRIYGRIPQWFNSQLSKLSYLDLSGNKLSGELSVNLLELPSLSKLNCSNNYLRSHLPDRKFVSKIDSLDLHSNEITGSIKQSFLNSLPKLVYLDLSYNKLTGDIPVGIEQPPMQFLGLDGNGFKGQILHSLDYKELENDIVLPWLTFWSSSTTGWKQLHRGGENYRPESSWASALTSARRKSAI
ncbi:hypothetical protein R1sor_019102 [Riccia sorocarpa]|uniref:Leucine-rich repeat-containing N-terminal plant-type domain-containing protein n=1 Tax=Riccia sorocarpa TaxID=122646 RepID=A0ABD3IF65_9MARC